MGFDIPNVTKKAEEAKAEAAQKGDEWFGSGSRNQEEAEVTEPADRPKRESGTSPDNIILGGSDELLAAKRSKRTLSRPKAGI